MTYAEKLDDVRWQKRRLERLGAVGFKCQGCPTEIRGRHIHHRYYIRGRDPWDYPDDALLVLCQACHDAAHAAREHLQMALAALPMWAEEEVACALDRILDSSIDEEEQRIRLRGWFHCTASLALCLQATEIMEGRY